MYVLIQKYSALELKTNGLKLTVLCEHNLKCYLNTYPGYGGLQDGVWDSQEKILSDFPSPNPLWKGKAAL